MPSFPSVRVVSHPLCPHAQRVRLTLAAKGLRQGTDYAMHYVDLAHIPPWFTELSPDGRMPVISVYGNNVVFSAAAAVEFLDELVGPRLLASDAVKRLHQRQALDESQTILTLVRDVFTAKSATGLEETTQRFFARLRSTRESLIPLIRARRQLNAVDIAFAPVFSMVLFYPWFAGRGEWTDIAELRAWGELLVNHKAVQASRCGHYHSEFVHFFTTVGAAFRAHARQPVHSQRYQWNNVGIH